MGRGIQSSPVLFIQGGLPIFEGKEVVSQSFADLDFLLLCRAGAPNVSRGITLSPIPVPHMLMLQCMVCTLGLLSPGFTEDFLPGLTDVMEDVW